MAGFRNISDDKGPLSDINITPLVDVMLVLLVIFMVCTPLMENGIPLQLPKATAKSLPTNERPVILSITKDAKLFLDKEELSMQQLATKLNSYFKGKAKKEVFIRADSSIQYGIVAQAIATIKNAGIEKVGLVTQPTETKK